MGAGAAATGAHFPTRRFPRHDESASAVVKGKLKTLAAQFEVSLRAEVKLRKKALVSYRQAA
jgi:hypothetical protein